MMKFSCILVADLLSKNDDCGGGEDGSIVSGLIRLFEAFFSD
jgi:hypothetical protein